MKDFFKHGLSLDEFKVSSLIIIFIILSGIAVYSYLTHGDVSANFVNLLNTNAVTVGGVNALKVVSDNVLTYRRNNQDNSQENQENQDNSENK